VSAKSEGDLSRVQRVDVRAGQEANAARRQVPRRDTEIRRDARFLLVPREDTPNVDRERTDGRLLLRRRRGGQQRREREPENLRTREPENGHDGQYICCLSRTISVASAKASSKVATVPSS
jgi:hypothetical protein